MSSRFSRLCESSEMPLRPSIPESPLSVCIERKTSLIVSGETASSSVARSSCTSRSPRASSSSSASMTNSPNGAWSRPSALTRPPLRRPAERRFDGPAQLGGAEGLDQVVARPEVEAPLAVLGAVLRGDDDHGDPPVVRVRAHEGDQLQPVDVGHVDVGHDQVHAAGRKHPQRLEAAGGLHDLDPLPVGQVGGDQRPRGRRVVHHQDRRAHRITPPTCCSRRSPAAAAASASWIFFSRSTFSSVSPACARKSSRARVPAAGRGSGRLSP